MAVTDDIVSEDLAARARPFRDSVVSRSLICFATAVIEGTAAALLVFTVALAYHVFFLDVSIMDFAGGFYAGFSLLTGVVCGAFAAAAGSKLLDGERRRHIMLSDSVLGWTAAVAVTLLTAFLLGTIGDLSRVSLTAGYVIGMPVMLLLRSYDQAYVARLIASGLLHFEKVAVIGNRVDVVNFLFNGELFRSGHKLVGTLYLEDVADETGALDPERITAFARDGLRLGADHLVVLGDLSDIDGLERLLAEIKRFALNVIYAPATANTTLKFLDVVAIGPNNALRFMRKPMSDAAVLLKRSTDLVLSGIGLLLLAPVFVLVALAIRIDSPGPVIYRQARRGFNGEIFMIWKFRSMSVTESGFAMQQATAGDARITRVGAFLRASSIDELPQLVNVLQGQMSLVGPRPHAVSHDEALSKQMENYAHRQRIKPGITGWAQVNGLRGETATLKQIEGRVSHDIFYIDNWSIFLDLWILILTVFSPATRRNAR